MLVPLAHARDTHNTCTWSVVPLPVAHVTSVQNELCELESCCAEQSDAIIASLTFCRVDLHDFPDCTETVAAWYLCLSEHGVHIQRWERFQWMHFNRLLLRLAVSWVSFICDECDPAERGTFRWATGALEFAASQTRNRGRPCPNRLICGTNVVVSLTDATERDQRLVGEAR